MVETFLVESGSFKFWAKHDELREASGALPQGSYTTLRTYRGDRVLRLEQHVQRLRESLAEPPALDVEDVRESLARALERTGHAESRLRLTFAPPRFFVTVARFAPPPPEMSLRGVRCVTVTDVHRDNPHAKHTGFIATAARCHDMLPPGVEEGLMVADDGAILEGLSSNFFAVSDGALWTEATRVLPGVTRAIVLELAETLLPLRPQALRVSQLPGIDECFLTSVSREVLPVVEVDGRSVADGKPGRTTRALMGRFTALVEREAKSVRP